MTTYNLEEDPNVFITPHLWDNKFLYRMEHFDAVENRKTIRQIDLRSDKLMVYGTEIKESMLQKLSESLILKSHVGILYVNCNGACYFLLTGKGCYRPIHNVIFDWSQFGVTVPNSVDDSLRKQLSSLESEALSTKTSLEASNKAVKELEGQLLACRKEKQDMEVDLRKVSGQLPLIGFELEISKIELESYKKEVNELEDQLSTCMEVRENMKLEVQKLQDDIEQQLSTYKKERQDMEDQLSLAKKELQYTKTQLESSQKMVLDHLWSINSEVKSTNQRLDQLLTSTLWNGLERCHLSQPIRLQAGTRSYTLPVIHELYDSMNNNLPIIFMATDDDDVPRQSSNYMKLD